MCQAAGRFDSGPAHQGACRIPDTFFFIKGPGGGQRRERRDGFRIIELVMSIIFSHIVIRKKRH